MAKKHTYDVTVSCDGKIQQTYSVNAENNRDAIRKVYYLACEWQIKPEEVGLIGDVVKNERKNERNSQMHTVLDSYACGVDSIGNVGCHPCILSADAVVLCGICSLLRCGIVRFPLGLGVF